MPNICAVFGCKINYNDDHRVPVFKLPTKLDDLSKTQMASGSSERRFTIIQGGLRVCKSFSPGGC